MRIRELNFDPKLANELIADLKKIMLDFEIVGFHFLDKSHSHISLTSIDEFFEEIETLPPRERNPVRVAFKYKRSMAAKRISGDIHLGSSPSESIVKVHGGTRSLQAQDCQKIFAVCRRHSRLITNSLGNVLIGYLPFIILFFVSLAWPSSIFKSSRVYSFLVAAITFPFALFFHYRPHTFIYKKWFDTLRIFPGGLKVCLIALAVLILTSLITYIPNLTGWDEYRVLHSPSIQRRVLREAMTPELLQAFRSLGKLNKLYDKADISEKSYLSKDLAGLVLAISKKFERLPISGLDLFLSTSSPLDSGNWMQEPLLLSSEIKKDEKGVRFIYKPNILVNGMGGIHWLGIQRWLSEPVLKDQYGTVWTRKKLISEEYAETLGDISIVNQNALLRLRKFPEDKIAVQVKNGPMILPQNSVEDESIRAISEELNRSLGKIQQTLSAYPGQ